MRAATPTLGGHVRRDGVRLGYEVFGSGDPTILLLPTWTIIHSRFWKMQVSYLARHYRVITYDGPGNGRSDRTTDPARYSPSSYAEDAVAILDACGADRVVAVGLSLGAAYGAMMASMWPERLAGLVMIGPFIPVTEPSPERASIAENLTAPLDPGAEGWEKYNIAYWHHDYTGFTSFFFEQCFSEPHSTKAIEDSVGWAEGAGSSILEAEARAASPPPYRWRSILESLTTPVLVVHGTADRISPHERGEEVTRLTGGKLLSMEGSGHIPNVRDPVIVNLAIRDFIESLP